VSACDVIYYWLLLRNIFDVCACVFILWWRSTGQQSEGADWGWDENYETEFDIRKRARNSQTDYKHDAYYGIKGIPRQSNNVVAGACCLLILLGGVYFYLGFKWEANFS